MIGDNIKIMRNNKKMYQQELADKLGVSKSTVAMWETNKREPNIETINNIAEILECSPSYLIGDNPEKKSGFRLDYSGIEAIEAYCTKNFGSKAEQKEAHSILMGLFDLNLSGLKKVWERICELKYIPDYNNTGITFEDTIHADEQNCDEYIPDLVDGGKYAETNTTGKSHMLLVGKGGSADVEIKDPKGLDEEVEKLKKKHGLK